MPEDHKISFTTEKSIRYRPKFNTVNCEKIHLADINGDGRPEIIISRCGSSDDKSTGEIAIYDLDLNLKACDNWDGTAMDVTAACIDEDEFEDIIVVGAMGKSTPMIRRYRYNEDYKDNLELVSQTTWKSPEGLFGTAKAIHITGTNGDAQAEIAVLTTVEGSGSNAGYAQLRLYDSDMQLKKVVRWKPIGGNVVKWGHCMTSADVDNDGHDELITLINFRHNGKQKADLRVFDYQLNLKQKCEMLNDETLFATRMSAGDIDGDGRTEIVVIGGAFTEVWQGATNQLMVFDSNLKLKSRTTWKTFRHSWVWDMQIADIDGDGNQEVITYGGTSMRGKNQEDANIMGEIRVWNGGDLTAKDMFVWQSRPGEDTRPSRGVAFRDDAQTHFVIATSKWSRRQRTPELEIRTLSYEPVVGVVERYADFIRAYSEKDVEFLGAVKLSLEDETFAPLALEVLAVSGHEKAAEIIGRILEAQDRLLFLRAVELLRQMGDSGLDQLRGIGFALPDDWAIVCPFDNTENKGFEMKYPPETEVDLDAFYAGRNRIVRWGKIGYSRKDVYIDLAYTHFDSFERTGIEFDWNHLCTESAAYALTYIHAPKNMDAQIKVGSSDGMKIWLGDELRYSSDASREAIADQDIISISLVEGENRILVKVANHKTNGWGFFFRITDSEGEPIPDLRYERPEVSHTHNQMLTYEQLIPLLESQDEHLRCLAAGQVASAGDKRGNESLFSLLQSEDKSIKSKAAFALTLAGDHRGADMLAESAPGRDHLFQIAAGYALGRAGDARAEQFSIDNLKDDAGRNIVEMKVTNRNKGFNISPMYKGDQTSHVDVSTDSKFHLGSNISATCARIGSFGINKPEYRGMGLGGIAIKRACEIIAEMGHSCSVVSTGTRLVAHRLYCRHGYVDRRFPWEYIKQLEKNDAAEIEGKVKIRAYTNADREDVNRLRKQYTSSTIGPADWSPRSNFGVWTRVAEDAGKIIGYADVYLDPFEPNASINLLHIDADYSDEQTAARTLFSAIHNYALEEGKKKLTFRDPPMRYRDILLGMGYTIESGCIRYGWVNMFKVIDLPKLLREISGLLSLRLQRSALAGWCGSIGIKGLRLNATLAIGSDGKINVEDEAAENADLLIVADDTVITSLVSGNEDVWESYRQHTLTVKPILNERIRRLVESLFPIMPHKQGGWW